MNMQPLILASYFGTSATLLMDILAKLKPGVALNTLNVLTITTPTNPYSAKTSEPIDWLEEELSALEAIGLNLIRYDIAGKTPAELTAKLATADIIYVTGGNTYYLLQEAQKSGFMPTLKARLTEGALYMGSSAGAAFTCPKIDYIEDMDEPEDAPEIKDFTGLNLTPFYIMPHINADNSASATVRQIMAKPQHVHLPFIGLHDSQIALVAGNSVEIFPN